MEIKHKNEWTLARANKFKIWILERS